MPGYVVAFIQRIHDMETYKQYVAQVEPTLAPFGGRFLARKPDPDALEGAGVPSRAVILEFPSVEKARAWHASPRYQPIMKLRQSASEGTLILLPSYGEARVAEGDVHYLEFVTPEVDATRRLLEGLHGWRFDAPREELGGSLVATLPNGARCGVRAPLRESEMPVTRAYVRVADVVQAAERVEQLGGFVALPPIELGHHGTIAIYVLGGVDHGLWQLP